MNLLIVDDEISSIRAVSGMLDWAALGIDQCLTALSVQEAKNLIRHGEVDLLLCDIEMPQENGLDLLEWVNGQGIDICCVYMTCYAEFSYAQRAMSLGSLGYLLKPIDPGELEMAIASAIRKKREQDAAKSEHFALQSAHLALKENEEKICQQFWLNLFYGEIPSSRDAIRQELYALRLPLDADWYYCACLVVVRNWGREVEHTRYIDRYAVHNIAEELFRNETEKNTKFHIIYPFGQHGQMCLCGGPDQEILSTCCRRFAEAYLAAEERYLDVRSVCYLSQATLIEDTAAEMECLMRMDNTHLKNHGLSVHSEERQPSHRESDLNDKFDHWTNMLEGELFDKVRVEIDDYLTAQEGNVWFNKNRFQYFLRDYSGMLVGYGSRHQLSLKVLTEQERDADCFERSSLGLDNMRAWVDCSLGHLKRLNELGGSDPITAAKAFIEANLSTELDGAQIADHVHLSQDYLSRIFKQETGLSIRSYVINRKMEWAQELLKTSRMPIADVAYKVGYSNYTSFNRIFKKTWGTSPQSYRDQAD